MPSASSLRAPGTRFSGSERRSTTRSRISSSAPLGLTVQPFHSVWTPLHRRCAARYCGARRALVTVVFWGSAFVGIRSAGRSFSAGPLSLGRLLVAASSSKRLHRAGGAPAEPRRSPRGRRAAARRGLLWFGAYNLMLAAGEQSVDAGTAAMLVNVGPVLIAILAGLLLGEGFPRALFLGCAVAFAGVAVIALATAKHSATTGGCCSASPPPPRTRAAQ